MKSKLLLFIHGLGGHPTKTWGSFFQLIKNEKELDNLFEIGTYQYPTSLFRFPFSQETPKIQTLANGLRTQINNTFLDFGEIILICHSLGGLVARKYLLDEVKYNRTLKVRGLLLYATPNNGAGLASIAKHVSWKHNQLVQLCKDSDLIESLNEDWFLLKINELLPIKYVVAGLDSIVSEQSAKSYWGNPNIETIPDKGHRDLVKPARPDDLPFLILKNFVQNAPKLTTPKTQLLRSPEIGAEFWQGNIKNVLTSEGPRLVRVFLNQEPFEIRIPQQSEKDEIRICAWVDNTIFYYAKERLLLENIPFFRGGTGVMDPPFGSGTLCLGNDLHNYFDSGGRLYTRPDATHVIAVNSFSSFQQHIGLTHQEIPKRKDIFLVIYLDNHLSDAPYLTNYECFILSF